MSVSLAMPELRSTDAASVRVQPRTATIMFLVSHSSPGGVQEIWANLAEGFLVRGFDVRLAALYPRRSPARETASQLPWRYVVPAAPRSPIAFVHLVRALVRTFRETNADVVFTAMPAANVLAAVCVWVAGVKTRTVLSHHSPIETHNPVLNAIDAVAGCLGNVHKIVSVSNFVASSLETKPRLYRAKRRTITNALPPRIRAYLAELASRHERRRAMRRTVVATGRLAPQKNYPVLIRAAALMPNVEVQIIGVGPDEAALRALAAELKVEERVKFLGHFPREDALALLAEGDVFVQPSLFEGHSLALIEAANLRLPLVVSNVAVQIEGITAADGSLCGIAVGVDDHAALAKAILGLLDDPSAYAAWSERARQLAEASDYDRMIEAYLEEVA